MHVQRLGLPLLLAAFFLAACVTVNIYFPAPAMSKAADRLVKEVWGEEGQPLPGAPPAPSAPDQPRSSWQPGWVMTWLLDGLSAPAWAQEADIDVSTAGIRALKERMQERAAALGPLLDQGALGIDRQGDLAVREEGRMPVKELAQARRLASAENQDRAALYREIAQANGHPEWEPRIRAIFAATWQARARAGWWIEEGSHWRQR